MKNTHKKITLYVIMFCFNELFGSPQKPDYIIYGKDTFETYNLILEQYLQGIDTANTKQLFGLSFRDAATLNCWRGYQALYKIEHDSLFLVAIINCGELSIGTVDTAKSSEKIKSIFGSKYRNNRVMMDWYDGNINFPLTNKVLRWDGVFYKLFEKEKVISISKGLITKLEDVENYIDDPNRINRRDKNKISKLLLKKLKKTKWKNKNGFECDEQYVVTIDENGTISKVRSLYSEEDGKYFNNEEYDFCINKILNALKDLKFDIIKDKGKPISESIILTLL